MTAMTTTARAHPPPKTTGDAEEQERGRKDPVPRRRRDWIRRIRKCDQIGGKVQISPLPRRGRGRMTAPTTRPSL